MNRAFNFFGPRFGGVEGSIITQNNIMHDMGPLSANQMTQIGIQCAIYYAQVYYDLFSIYSIEAFIGWMLCTGNFFVVLLGSCRAHDRIMFLQLFVAAFFSFFYRLYMLIPIVAVMLFQTYMRYDASLLDEEREEQEPDSDSEYHPDHPENWRNNLLARNNYED